MNELPSLTIQRQSKVRFLSIAYNRLMKPSWVHEINISELIWNLFISSSVFDWRTFWFKPLFISPAFRFYIRWSSISILFDFLRDLRLRFLYSLLCSQREWLLRLLINLYLIFPIFLNISRRHRIIIIRSTRGLRHYIISMSNWISKRGS